MKRIFDIVTSLIALVILLPVFITISIWILLDSRGGIIYRQLRAGKNNRDFFIFKFRTMRPASDAAGLLTIGGRDPRITHAGYYLRKSKLDELPQLFNIIMGKMSIVGPRPEVRKYVKLYTEEHMKVFDVRPGLTDYASLEYIDESNILAASDDPEKTYIETIMPAKLDLNLKYIRERSMGRDIKIIFTTIIRIFK
ncbi:MAG: sugar transferase [Bacteroidetes bacterium]|nr:MAG: sugar transferase [Bacteroidota bacterium]